MFDYLCYKPMNSLLPKQEEPPPSYARLFQASFGCRMIDVYMNDHMVAKKFGYKKYTPYYPIPSGYHSIDIYKSGCRDKLLASLDVNLEQNRIYTIIIEGITANRILLVHDARTDCCENKANIRFINISPTMEVIDIATHEGEALLSHLSYRSIPEYTQLDSGKHTFHVKQNYTSKSMLLITENELKSGWNYTSYIIGTGIEKSPIHWITLIDGSTYIAENRQAAPDGLQ